MTHSTNAIETTASTPSDDRSAPVIMVVGDAPELSDALTRLGAALDLEIRQVRSFATMMAELHEARPIGLACGLSGTGVATARQALKDAAKFNRALPVLLVTDGDPETLGCLDAISALCGLAELQRLTAPPRIEEVLAFVARAGRRSGRLGLMAV